MYQAPILRCTAYAIAKYIIEKVLTCYRCIVIIIKLTYIFILLYNFNSI